MEATGLADGTVVDLDLVDGCSRVAAWREAAPMLLPNLDVRFASDANPAGSLAYAPLGDGAIWAIHSSPATVEYQAPSARSEAPDRIALCMQMEGSARIAHGGTQLVLDKGDIAVVDERMSFEVSSPGTSSLAIVQFPREVALSRVPLLNQLPGTRFSRGEPGPAILGDLILSLSRNCIGISGVSRADLLLSLLNIFSTCLGGRTDARLPRYAARVSAAGSFIAARFADLGLTPQAVAAAQGVSRRRLDQIMIETTGESIAGHIWKLRLDHAAAELASPANAGRSIISIAFESGFKDSAHFSRMFKLAYGQSPSRWRLSKNGAAQGAALPL